MKPFAFIFAALAASLTSTTYATVIAFNGFEPDGDTWTQSGATSSSLNGSGDTPIGQRIFAGTQSFQVINGTSVSTFSSVSIIDYSNVFVTYHVSSTAGSSGNGAEIADTVEGYVALNGNAFGTTPDVLITGAATGNSRWSYNAAGPTTTAGVPFTAAATNSGNNASGPSSVRINIPATATAVALKLTAKNNAADERWNIDSVSLEGNARPVFNATSGYNVTVDVSPPGLESVPTLNGTVTDSDSASVIVVAANVPSFLTFATTPGNAAQFSFTSNRGLTYSDAGTYTVTLTADDLSGTRVSTYTINVVPEPTALAALGIAFNVIRRRR